MDERLRRRTWGLVKQARRRLAGARPAHPTPLFILGCQRSGTTMLIETLDKDWRVKTFGEFSAVNEPAVDRRPWSMRSASRYSIRMKPLNRVAAQIARSRFPLVVLKPLVESQRAPQILEALAGARCLWVFRHYRDVARSNVELFSPDLTRVNLGPIARGERGNWRSEFVSADVQALVARHYSSELSPYDGAALFWYARNRLFFDLDLDRESRVLAIRYEDMVTDPERSLRMVYRHAGSPFPGPSLVADIHRRSLGRGRGLGLSDEIEGACERLWVGLNDAYERQLSS